MRFASYLIVRATASIAVGLLVLCFQTDVRAQEGGVVGFQDASGKTLFLHDFKGKPVLINLWATWCEPCVAEMPSLAKLQQEYASQGLVVIALSEDDSLQRAIDFYKKKNLTTLTPYFDKGHAIWTALQARGVPTTVLVTKNGDMVQRIEGPVDWQSPQVRSLINEIVR